LEDRADYVDGIEQPQASNLKIGIDETGRDRCAQHCCSRSLESQNSSFVAIIHS
jgi:hypothetical protein